MELKTKWKKIISVFLFITILCSCFLGNFSTVYGRINSIYSQGEVSGTIDIEQASSDSTLLDAIGHFVYAIAGFIESIVGKIIGSFTGDNIFPWADRIVFNTIPFLDVNFLSPSNGSMFRDKLGTNTMFGNIIGNIYYTVFTLAVAFFGVVVGIMAMRLAISSIASEKAKYKQAITNWLLALILLFTTHYLMSFVFFINEKMVEVASSIFQNQVEENQDQINLDFSVTQDQAVLDKLFNEFFKLYFAAEGKSESVYVLLDWDYRYFSDHGAGGSFDSATRNEKTIKLATLGDVDDKNFDFHYKFYTHIDNDSNYQNDGNLFQFDGTGSYNWNAVNDWTKGNVPNEFEQKFKVYLFSLMNNSNYLEEYRHALSSTVESMNMSASDWVLTAAGIVPGYTQFSAINLVSKFADKKAATRDMRRVINDALFLTNYDSSISEENASNFDTAVVSYQKFSYDFEDQYISYDADTNYNEDIIRIFKKAHGSIDKKSNYNEEAIISNLADFFKETIYISSMDLDYNADEGEELVNIEFQPIVAILYAIFVIQSIMYFIAYIKRFFYIVVLALFAPLVIIYDFLMKTSLG